MLNSIQNCPFDGDFCQEKQNRFDEYRIFAMDNCDSVVMNLKVLDGCPFNTPEERQQKCVRYHRYLHIVENVKKELAQQQNER